MATHRPGPWKPGRMDMISWHANDTSRCFKNVYAKVDPEFREYDSITGAEIPFVLAEVYGTTREETLANARLVGAAPELFEIVEYLSCCVEGAAVTEYQLQKAKGVLAKIRGEG